MGTRLDLQTLLEGLLGSSNVYFQPPSNISMEYPAIVYNRDYQATEFADNIAYSMTTRYRVTVIAKDPDSPIPSLVGGLPMSTFVRHYAFDNLNHDIYDVYF
jgi:hypothetical protein